MEKDKTKAYRSFNEWQCEIYKRHPLLSRFATSVLSGLLIAFIVGNWAIGHVPPNPKVIYEKTAENNYQVTIKNEGIFPANRFYNVVSGNSVIISPNIIAGNPHVEVTPDSGDKFKLLLKDLPRGQKVIIDFPTGNLEVKAE